MRYRYAIGVALTVVLLNACGDSQTATSTSTSSTIGYTRDDMACTSKSQMCILLPDQGSLTAEKQDTVKDQLGNKVTRSTSTINYANNKHAPLQGTVAVFDGYVQPGSFDADSKRLIMPGDEEGMLRITPPSEEMAANIEEHEKDYDLKRSYYHFGHDPAQRLIVTLKSEKKTLESLTVWSGNKTYVYNLHYPTGSEVDTNKLFWSISLD